MENLIKPNKLKVGDRIGLVSLSAPMAGLVPHRTERGIKMLEQMGFKVVLGKNALKTTGYTAGTPEERAEDLNNFFKDEKIKAVISFIGGFHSNQILKYLDYHLISHNPKIFMGYSDMSVVHLALNTRAKLITFYGPSVLNQFADNPSISPYSKEYFEKAVMTDMPIGDVVPSTYWTDELLNWFEKKDLERPRKLFENEGFKWLKEGTARGQILGGCITSILHLRGTEYWPDFKEKILFWEISESSADMSKGEPVARVDAHLTDLELSGVFSQIKGMIIGRPYGYTNEQTIQLQEVIIKKTKEYNFPILFNVNVGHVDPIITIPIGVMTEIDSQNNRLSIIESGVK